MKRHTLSRPRIGPAALAAAGLLLLAAPARAADEKPAVARSASADGTLLRREAPGKPWQMVKQGADLHAGELLLGMYGAALETPDGSVRLTFLSDPTNTSPFPIVETAVVLHPPPAQGPRLRGGSGADLDFTLDRGRVVVEDRKKAGPAKAAVRIRDRSAELTLAAPGARVAIEIYGRWPAGVPFEKEPGPDHQPGLDLLAICLSGEAGIKGGRGRYFALTAPPGPALVEMSAATGGDIVLQKLDKLPAWAEVADTPELRKRKAALDELRKLALEKSPAAAIQSFLHSDDPLKRRVAVFAMGATDDLRGLGDALRNAKHPDVWDNGVIALRHWIGRGPGQDRKLYDALVKEGKLPEADAETIMQLLHSPGEDLLREPAYYQALIDFLDNDRLAIRGLAHWHLVRLVPGGRELGFDPLAPKEARDKAVAAWRKLVPAGQLPKPATEKPK